VTNGLASELLLRSLFIAMRHGQGTLIETLRRLQPVPLAYILGFSEAVVIHYAASSAITFAQIYQRHHLDIYDGPIKYPFSAQWQREVVIFKDGEILAPFSTLVEGNQNQCIRRGRLTMMPEAQLWAWVSVTVLVPGT
jgi:hypothetical protein